MKKSPTTIEVERREYPRSQMRAPLQCKLINESSISKTTIALCTVINISHSGICFEANFLPRISEILWLRLDKSMIPVSEDFRENLIFENGGVLGRVARIQDLDENRFAIAVCFLTDDSLGQELKYFSLNPSASEQV